jgi:hypothetical protein
MPSGVFARTPNRFRVRVSFRGREDSRTVYYVDSLPEARRLARVLNLALVVLHSAGARAPLFYAAACDDRELHGLSRGHDNADWLQPGETWEDWRRTHPPLVNEGC